MRVLMFALLILSPALATRRTKSELRMCKEFCRKMDCPITDLVHIESGFDKCWEKVKECQTQCDKRRDEI